MKSQFRIRFNNIGWAFLFIALAVLLLVNAMGWDAPITDAIGEVKVVQLIFGLLLFAISIEQLLKRDLAAFFFLFSILFMIFERNIAFMCGREDPNLINNGIVFLMGLLLGIGFSMLIPKRKRRFCRVRDSAPSDHRKHDEKGKHSHSLGSQTVYIDCTSFFESTVENNIGSTVVYFENIDAYGGGGMLHVENNLGSLVIDVPGSWHVICQIDNNLGSVQNQHDAEGTGPTLTIVGDNNLGSMVIRKR